MLHRSSTQFWTGVAQRSAISPLKIIFCLHILYQLQTVNKNNMHAADSYDNQKKNAATSSTAHSEPVCAGTREYQLQTNAPMSHVFLFTSDERHSQYHPAKTSVNHRFVLYGMTFHTYFRFANHTLFTAQDRQGFFS